MCCFNRQYMDRSEQELDILEQISQILGDGLELTQVFRRVMLVLSERLGVERAAFVLRDDASGQLRTIAAVGLSTEEIARGRYAPGEGVTGQVIASGRSPIIRDVSQHPEFLNRTGARPLRSIAAGPG